MSAPEINGLTREQKLQAITIYCLLDPRPKPDLIRFQEARGFETLTQATDAFNALEIVIRKFARAIPNDIEETDRPVPGSSSATIIPVPSDTVSRSVEDALVNFEVIRWHPQDTLLTTLRKTHILALQTRVILEREASTTRNSRLTAEKALKKGVEAGDECFIKMVKWLYDLLCGTGLERFEEHLFDVAHAEAFAEASFAVHQGSTDEHDVASSMRGVQQAYQRVRNGRTKTKEDVLAHLKSMVAFYQQHKELWSKIEQQGSAERAYILGFKPDDPDWRLKQGVGIMTLAWRWLVLTTHGHMCDESMRNVKIRMRDDIYVGRRISEIQHLIGDDVLYLFTENHKTQIKALKGTSSALSAFISTVDAIMGEKLRAVYKQGILAFTRKSLESDVVVNFMRERFSAILENSIGGSEAMVKALFDDIQQRRLHFLDDEDDYENDATTRNRSVGLARGHMSSTSSTLSSIDHEDFQSDENSDQDGTRNGTEVDNSNRMATPSHLRDQHEYPFMAKRQKILKNSQGLTKKSKVSLKQTFQAVSGEDKENEVS